MNNTVDLTHDDGEGNTEWDNLASTFNPDSNNGVHDAMDPIDASQFRGSLASTADRPNATPSSVQRDTRKRARAKPHKEEESETKMLMMMLLKD